MRILTRSITLRKPLVAVGVAAALAAFGQVHAADCAESIAEVESAIERATDSERQAQAREHLSEARDHLEMDHEDVCKQHVEAARAALNPDTPQTY